MAFRQLPFCLSIQAEPQTLGAHMRAFRDFLGCKPLHGVPEPSVGGAYKTFIREIHCFGAVAQAWRGWLYSGGAALVCASPAQHATALLASLDPSIVKRQNTGVDAEQLQALQVHSVRKDS